MAANEHWQDCLDAVSRLWHYEGWFLRSSKLITWGCVGIVTSLRRIQESKSVVVKDKPIPEPGPNQFLIKLASASLCHSDIMAIEGGQTATLGHEGSGYIEKMHPSVEDKGFTKGDKVGFLYINGCCFECEGCMIHNLHVRCRKPPTKHDTG